MLNDTLVPPAPVDCRLPERLRRRDPEALGALFDRFAPNVYALLSPVEADAARLDQLVEDVFWETWTLAGRAGSESKVLQIMLRAVSSRLRGPDACRSPEGQMDEHGKDRPPRRGQ